ncbi:MAG: xylulokinase [Polyangiaceae bacterium]|nr:xylulokinase [Polyangiaceae bacterium]
MYLGIDLGTSSVKALLVDEEQRIVAEASEPLTVSRPHPLWSEQDPAHWWQATERAVHALRVAAPAPFAAVRAIGLSGQMHGATLLDREQRVLRPAILWNDGRSAAECAELEAREPRTRTITANAAMAGFTAPKLLWVRKHEPEVFARTAYVLLPKDWIRLEMTGELASDPSDAAGTLWLDVEHRTWSGPMLEACGLGVSAMPKVVEGSRPTGTLRPAVAQAWGLSPSTVVAAGGGDNAAGAVGVGVISPGQALLSMGTSGVVFLVTERCSPSADRGVHAFCHAIPETWHQMSVMLSSASCLAWIVGVTGARNEVELLSRIESEAPSPSDVVFLPYLSGERTPHNDPYARGVFFGMTHATGTAHIARAVLEGVAYAFADGVQMLREAGGSPREITVIGGGSRSPLWTRIVASALGETLLVRERAELGPAFGAARLARLAVTGEAVADVCPAPPVVRRIEPDDALREHYARGLTLYRDLYARLHTAFPR